MKMSAQIQEAVEGILSQLDTLGYKLDVLGVENNINRHTLIASVMAGQKRLEGELDSISAKVDSKKVQAEALIDTTEKYLMSGVNLAVFPAKYTFDRVRSQF